MQLVIVSTGDSAMSDISQGSVTIPWDVVGSLVLIYYKFSPDSDRERILKIG